jgi:DNA-binding beta-propeller fold protein YncE
MLCLGFALGAAHAADPKTLELIQTIPLESGMGRYDHLALDEIHSRLFLANLSNNSFDIVDLKAGKLAKQIPGQKKIQGVAYAADLDRIFVGNGADGVCKVFDGRNYELLRSIPLPDADNVRYDPAAHVIYVTNEDGVAAIDAKTLDIKAKIPLPGPPEALQFDGQRKRLFVNTHKPSQVAVIDLEKHKVVAQYPIKSAEANYPMALDAQGQRVFVGCRKKPCIVVLDARNGNEISVVPIPGDIDDLFYDAANKRLFGTCGAGVIAVVQQNGEKQLEVVETIPTAKLARTGLFDPKKRLLYVVLPRQGKNTGPELRVYHAKS